MNNLDSARRYAAKCPAAISGQAGHNQAFSVVCAVVNGFALDESQAFEALRDWNATCQPPWSERELRHKITSALNTPHSKPRGHLLQRGVRARYQAAQSAPTVSPRPVTPPTPAAAPERKYDVPDTVVLPDPLPNPMGQLLLAAFESGEGVRIAGASRNEDGREVPRDAGVTLSREEWLRKLSAAGGDANRATFRSSDKTGVFCSINPLKLGGSKDADVTAYRHALVEFDGISREEQWTLISASHLPVTAVISSGNKSLHAWVRVDAATRTEYDERVSTIYGHFSGAQKPDEKNKNPSRFSRLPGCERGKARQELLAVGIGDHSWSEWLKRCESESLGRGFTVREIRSRPYNAAPGCILGFDGERTRRYLSRGKSAWIIGPSGIGKSSLLMEFAIGWALGRPVFGIRPSHPLKSLIIQAENDADDLAEFMDGISRGYVGKEFGEEGKFDSVEEFDAALDGKIILRNEEIATARDFVDKLHRWIDLDKPDIVWVDPLLSFAGIDVLKQDQCSMFLRNWLNPVLSATGCVLIGMHHTGKPRPLKERAEWSPLEHAYAGLGSSELVNWARAVMTVQPTETGDGTYCLILAKRGPRAGATHPDGSPARRMVYIRHATDGTVRWEQCEPPHKEEKEKQPKLSKPQQIAAMNLAGFIAACPAEGEGLREITRRLSNWLASKDSPQKLSASDTSVRAAVSLLVENGKLSFRDKTFFRGENA